MIIRCTYIGQADWKNGADVLNLLCLIVRVVVPRGSRLGKVVLWCYICKSVYVYSWLCSDSSSLAWVSSVFQSVSCVLLPSVL